MNAFLLQYLPIVIFLGIGAVIGVAFLAAAAVLAPNAPDPEKLSAYECGFNPFDDARMQFDVRFYLVAILFILFDIETVFLVPWAVTFRSLGVAAFVEVLVFVGILIAGYVYVWKRRALEWD